MPNDSNGYEAIADHFIRARTHTIGPTIVRKWATGLRPGAYVLDIGCGYGVPISEALLQEEFTVYGVDPSPTLVSRFRERFPNVPIECNSIEDSFMFSPTFDAVVVWGVIFILPIESQRILISKAARALHSGGNLLLTSPKQACTWTDSLTGFTSISLGHEIYEQELAAHGLALIGNDEDEGGNYYYFAVKL